MQIFIQIDSESLSSVLGSGNLMIYKIDKVNMLMELIIFPESDELRELRRK